MPGLLATADTFGALNALGQLLSSSDSGQSWVIIEVTGLGTVTLTLEGWVSPTGAAAPVAVAVANLNAPTTFVTTITAAGLYKADITGLFCQLKATAFTSGNLVANYAYAATGGGS